MSAKVEFVQVLGWHIEHVAENMREADKVEVMALRGHSPLEALTSSIGQSELAATALVNGFPVAILGMVRGTITSNAGVPWMLGTDDLFSHPRQLLEWGRVAVDEMMRSVDVLQNYVHAENTKSIRWLKRLGFSFGEHLPIGRDGEMFARFWMENDNV